MSRHSAAFYDLHVVDPVVEADRRTTLADQHAAWHLHPNRGWLPEHLDPSSGSPLPRFTDRLEWRDRVVDWRWAVAVCVGVPALVGLGLSVLAWLAVS